jgi:D-lactate dehydrogenase (cytochrome)
MLTRTEPEQIQSYLDDSSHMRGGFADRVVFPESAGEVSEILVAASQTRTPVTVSGAGTGTVGGRVPFGGTVLALDRLNHIISIGNDAARAEAGVVLSDLQHAVEARGLLYPPDPTERSCFLGGNIATNASGSRTFKYGPTRDYVKGLKIAFASGDIIDLKRGELFADQSGKVTIPLKGKTLEAQLPSYHMPRVRKHASGYFVEPAMDVVDLFIGSEGTLGVVLEAELRLLPKPSGLLSGVIFFSAEADLLSFVRTVRERSLRNRERVSDAVALDARALEYFDTESLKFLRQKYDAVPEEAAGAIFFEQETTAATEDSLLSEWASLIDLHHALSERSWFATNETDHRKLREFRHALPVLMNEWFARYQQKKVSTDMAVPDEQFPEMLEFYRSTLSGGDLRYTIFGHIGDNHVHVNILPRDEDEAEKAWAIYRTFIRRAVEVGGTISAEHGIGKLKREYLRELYGDRHIREMAALKKAFDPAGILGRGNMFAEEYL